MWYELIVIGGGPAGLAAACAAYRSGLRKILVLERDTELGGILNQCIHNGFGLHYFKEELTGPEYAARFIHMLAETTAEVMLDATVLQITPEREVHVLSASEGYRVLRAGGIVLAMGCRERTRGAIGIPGDRPSGIFTAGAAQRYINMEGYRIGRNAVILGSGDIGLIMARRMTLEGARVLACVELMPYAGGLNRNIVQCLDDYQIPLLLSHTVTGIHGRKRLERVTISKVDENLRPVAGTETALDCDTLLLSVGLIPENELSRQAGIAIDPRTGGAVVFENMETSVPGVFACGNAAHVHDLVDYVTQESERAGRAAASFVQNGADGRVPFLNVGCGEGVKYVLPQKIRRGLADQDVDVFFRVDRVFRGGIVRVMSGKTQLARYPRAHMAPGEMERIRLPAAALKNAKGALSVAVEDAEG